jgi:hypothetical protein
MRINTTSPRFFASDVQSLQVIGDGPDVIIGHPARTHPHNGGEGGMKWCGKDPGARPDVTAVKIITGCWRPCSQRQP